MYSLCYILMSHLNNKATTDTITTTKISRKQELFWEKLRLVLSTPGLAIRKHKKINDANSYKFCKLLRFSIWKRNRLKKLISIDIRTYRLTRLWKLEINNYYRHNIISPIVSRKLKFSFKFIFLDIKTGNTVSNDL